MTKAFPPNRWTLERFGMTPGKLRHRAMDPRAPKAFCDSIPKAGTHLLERAVCLHPRMYRRRLPTIGDGNVERYGGLESIVRKQRGGQVVVSHLRFQDGYPPILASRGVLPIFLIRDPRDVVVSQVHFVTKTQDHRQHEVFAAIADPKERLRLSIQGDPALGVASIAERLDWYAGWLSSGALIVRFEDLVGPGGGGDADAQRRAVTSIYGFLGLGHDQDLIGSVCGRLFSSDSPTFRKGAIGQWEDQLDEELRQLFDETVGDRMTPYGYQHSGQGRT